MIKVQKASLRVSDNNRGPVVALHNGYDGENLPLVKVPL